MGNDVQLAVQPRRPRQPWELAPQTQSREPEPCTSSDEATASEAPPSPAPPDPPTTTKRRKQRKTERPRGTKCKRMLYRTFVVQMEARSDAGGPRKLRRGRGNHPRTHQQRRRGSRGAHPEASCTAAAAQGGAPERSRRSS